MQKSELRKIYLAERKTLSPDERSGKNRQIADNFFQYFNLSQIRFLHCFLPIEKFNEIDTKRIFEGIWKNFPRIETLAPRVNFQTGEIESVRFTPETELFQNRWQIYEPARDEIIEAEKIDLVVVPLLCFDRRGFRVGYGKGFYDRFLNRCRKDCLKVGLSYFPPVAEIEDVHKFDVKLDFCVTPEEVFHHREYREHGD
jgi:5-formyltetrahydrofolate cyclo-ligase